MKSVLIFSFMVIKIACCSQTCGNITGTYRPVVTANNNKYWVRIFYHIVRTTNHTGGLSPAQLGNITTKLNSDFNQYGIYFNMAGTDFIDNDSFYNLTDAAYLWSQNPVNNSINVYFINSYSSNSGPLIGGCAQDINSKAFFVVNNNVDAVSHEMGHCFGLYHTHRGTSFTSYPENGAGTCPENIYSSNCTTCGDYICDTPADPGLGSPSGVDSNCIYIGTYTQNGATYHPDTHNIMSYSGSCRNRFSTQQVYAMKNVLIGNPVVDGTLPFPIINGLTNNCSSGTYSCTNLVSGFVVAGWQSSNTAVAAFSGATLAKASNGIITIAATIAQGAFNYFAYKTVYVGAPVPITGTCSYGYFTFPVSYPSTGVGLSNSTPYVNVNLTSSDPTISYTWATVYMSGNSQFSYSGSNATVTLSGGAARNVTSTATNACGSGTIEFDCYNYSSFAIAISPNPVSTELTVAAFETSTNLGGDVIVTQNLEDEFITLMDGSGCAVVQSKFMDKSISFDLQKIPNGIYFLTIGSGDKKIVKRILVNH